MADCHICGLSTCCQRICISRSKTRTHSLLRFNADILHSLGDDSSCDNYNKLIISLVLQCLNLRHVMVTGW